MWKRVLLLGIVLGLLQILLIYGWAWLQQYWSFAWVLASVLSILCYLAIPALDGFLASRQDKDPDAAFAPGIFVGGIGFLVTLLITFAPPQANARPPEDYTGFSFAVGGLVILFILAAFFFLEVFFLGPLGGWLGDRLGRRYRAASSQRGSTSTDLLS
jgi:cobalamin synthase